MSLRGPLLAVVAVIAGTLAGADPTGAAPGAAPSAATPAAAAITSLQRDYLRIEAPIGRYLTDGAGDILPPFSSPAVGDVTGDGVLDLVHGAPNGFLYLFRATDGALQRTLLVGDGMIVSSPTLTDIDNDGRLDILVGLMPTVERTGVPTIVGFDGATGRTLFSRSTCTFGGNCDVFTTVVAADLDGDNDEEIIATSQNSRLQAWRGNGAEFFAPLHFLDTTRASPAVGDLDGDGLVEIVMVTDLDTETCRFGGTVLQGPPGRGCLPGERGSMIWIVNGDGTVRNRRFLQREIVYSAPSIGDLTGDGRNEIVVGSGTYFAVVAPGSTGGDERNVTALDASLNILPGWPVRLDSRTIASPALVDADNDGAREVATMDSSGRLYLIGANGQFRWRQCARDVNPGCQPTVGQPNDGATGIDGSPVAADVDGDGQQEIVTLGERTLQVRDARTGAVEASDNLQLNPELLTNQVATPVVYADAADATRIAAHVLWDPDRNGRGAGDAEGIVQWRTGATLGRADWPAFRANPRTRTGSVPVVAVDVAATPEGRYVAKAYLDLLGRPVDPVGQRYWYGVVRRQGRQAFTRGIVFSPTCEWPRRVVNELYIDILGRPADGGGLAYWSARVCAGEPARAIASLIYGSPEYYRDQGGSTPEGYVRSLYADILGRPADAPGLAFWAAEVRRRGIAPVAGDFYQSLESRERRVRRQYDTLLRRAPELGGLDYWAGQLLAFDDLTLTVVLTASDEYFSTPGPG